MRILTKSRKTFFCVRHSSAWKRISKRFSSCAKTTKCEKTKNVHYLANEGISVTDALKQINNIERVAVGIGSGIFRIYQPQLKQIGRDDVINVNSFNAYALNDIVNTLSGAACTTSAPVNITKTIKNTLRNSTSQHVKYMDRINYF